MTKSQFKKINDITNLLIDLTADETTKEHLSSLLKVDDLREIQETAQDTYDNKSERWQESDAGVSETERIDAIEQAIDSISLAVDELVSAKDALEQIVLNAPNGTFD